jgi:phosphoglycerol transferase MdoB-like AlkP superfamily enzyme
MYFGYYAYLQTPMNATVLRFAYNLSTSANMLLESYPMIWISLGLVIAIIGYMALLHHLLWRATEYANPLFRGWFKALLVSMSFILVIFGLYGKFSYYPLRWSEAFALPHAFAPAVTVNPILYFANTIKNKDVSYDIKLTRKAYPDMVEFLHVTEPDIEKLDYTRKMSKVGPFANKRPNIVMVFLESFASYKTGAFGNPLNPTPNFDKLSEQGLSFSRFYTPHTGTARSVFSAITGLVDVELTKTSTRNPLIVDQHTIVNAFEDYNKLYFLGGSANWGNIRGVLKRNIPGLQIYEEGSYKSKRVDVWGIPDINLFEEAHSVLTKQDKPFFAIIQTSGNHRPYTIPEDNHGFKLEHHSKSEYQNAGFISDAEYNSFRFMDHSVGHFMKLAEQSPYFDNTIFVFYGDHGITGYGGKHTPEFESKFILTGFHTPLVFYAPGLITSPITHNKIASEVDLLPTIAGLASRGYTNTTMGRDLLDTRYDGKRYAFTISHHNIPEIGLISQDYYFRMQADGTNKTLIHTSSANPLKNNIKQQPVVAEKMEKLTRDIYETTKYMRFHNKPTTLQ